MTFPTPHVGHLRHMVYFLQDWIVNPMLNLLKRTMTYPGFKPGTFGVAVNHYTKQRYAYLKTQSVKIRLVRVEHTLVCVIITLNVSQSLFAYKNYSNACKNHTQHSAIKNRTRVCQNYDLTDKMKHYDCQNETLRVKIIF
jgi:hypothetical protein